MNQKEAFTFCPKCGEKFTPQEDYSLICSKCNFHFYINVAACAGAIIENEKGEIVLVKRAHNPGKGEWDLPGGFINPNETFEQALLRELKEELNIEAKIERLISAHPNNYNYQGLIVSTMDIFALVSIVSGELKAGDDAELFQFFSKEELIHQKLWCTSTQLAIEDYLHSL